MDSLSFFIQDLELQINFLCMEACEGCNKKQVFHDCRSLSRYARRRLCFDAAWSRIGDDIKDRSLREIAKKELYKLDEGELL